MILENSRTCINTINGFVSEYFEKSRSARQGYPISPLLYSIQSEPFACTIRAYNDITGIPLPNRKYVNTNVFADDTQRFNKNENYIYECLKIIKIYEKASGSKINLNKTIGIYTFKKKLVYNNILWTKDNVKILGLHHGYNKLERDSKLVSTN